MKSDDQIVKSGEQIEKTDEQIVKSGEQIVTWRKIHVESVKWPTPSSRLSPQLLRSELRLPLSRSSQVDEQRRLALRRRLILMI